jgi:peptidoglycan/LPS O-acetylase OafA/YrhL
MQINPLKERAEALDGIRALAIFFVIFEHFGRGWGDLISAGYFGVNLFFVLSGFLITASLLQTEHHPVRTYFQFVFRRLIRIIPAYYLLIGFIFLISPSTLNGLLDDCLLFFYNYTLASAALPYSTISHCWSLCVEMQFYLVWPFLVLPFQKNKNTLIAISIIVTLLSWAQFFFNIIPGLEKFRWVGLLSNLYAFSIGATAYLLPIKIDFKNKLRFMPSLELVSLLLLSVLLIKGFGLKYIFCPVIAAYWIRSAFYRTVAVGQVYSLLCSRILLFTGKISYSIYLYHLPVYFLFKATWDRQSIWISLPLMLMISYLLASISYYWVERPFLAMKRRSALF